MTEPLFRGGRQIETVAVIGAGLIGSGWIATFLANGLAVRVFDPSPDAEKATRERLEWAWMQLACLGLSANASLEPLTFHHDLKDSVVGADFIQENAPERIELKRDLYTSLDAFLSPDVLIASSTSSFAIAELQSNCASPERCLLGHPINPVHLVPLIELAGGPATAPEAIATASTFYKRLGKKPVRLKKEVFGHVANRLASAMFQEAVHLVAEGVVDPSALDDIIRFGPALKWAIQGQFMTYHTSGGERGIEGFIDQFGEGQVRRWRDLGHPDLKDPAVRAAIVNGVLCEAAGRSVEEIARKQDTALVALRGLLG